MRSRNLREVAELCGVSRETVRGWVERGELAVYQAPGRAEDRVLVRDLVDFLRASAKPVPEELTGRPSEAGRED